MTAPLQMSKLRDMLPLIQKDLTAYCRTLVRAQEVENLVQDVNEAVLKSDFEPTDPGHLLGYAKGTAQKIAPRKMKRDKREKPEEAEVLEQAARAADPDRVRAMQSDLASLTPETATQAEAVQMVGEVVLGEKVADVAAKAGISTDTAWKRLHRASAWIKASIAIAFVCLLAVPFLKKNPPVVSAPPPPESVHPEEPTRAEVAASRRADAFKACEAEEWRECERLLDEAQRLDPEGDRDPRVQDARAAIERNRGGR
jgi:DNA-directed RNA polymerase specialized sigma24 family protein